MNGSDYVRHGYAGGQGGRLSICVMELTGWDGAGCSRASSFCTSVSAVSAMGALISAAELFDTLPFERALWLVFVEISPDRWAREACVYAYSRGRLPLLLPGDQEAPNSGLFDNAL